MDGFFSALNLFLKRFNAFVANYMTSKRKKNKNKIFNKYDTREIHQLERNDKLANVEI